jgi:hypothetical protein
MHYSAQNILNTNSTKNKHTVVLGRNYINLLRFLLTLIKKSHAKSENVTIIDCSSTLSPRYIPIIKPYKTASIRNLSIDTAELVKALSLDTIISSITSLASENRTIRRKLKKSINDACLPNYKMRRDIENLNILELEIKKLANEYPKLHNLLQGDKSNNNETIIKTNPNQTDAFYWLKLLLEHENTTGTLLPKDTNKTIYIFDPEGTCLKPSIVSLIAQAFRSEQQFTTIRYMTNVKTNENIGLKNLTNRSAEILEFNKQHNSDFSHVNQEETYIKRTGTTKQNTYFCDLDKIIKH